MNKIRVRVGKSNNVKQSKVALHLARVAHSVPWLVIQRSQAGNKYHNQYKIETMTDHSQKYKDQARVVRKVDSTIHRINHYPADRVVCFLNTFPLDSDLSSG